MSNTIVVQTGKARFAGFLPDTTQAAEFATQRSKFTILIPIFSFSNLSYYFVLHYIFCFFYKLHIFAFTCFKNECSILTDNLYFQVIAFTSHKASCKSCVGGKMYRKIIAMILCYIIYVLTLKINL